MKSVWRQIWILTFASLAVWAAALVIVRTVPPAAAQSTAEPAPAAPAPAPADEGATDDEPPIGAPVKPKEELPPDLRQSADNNVSFPVDI
ncbi:MAG: hypothetical protein CMLOHMNK_02790 [Steroidobacteraceae bacterium]|nr:hypothetical protein [Steroidobacteraceae bacterium]